MTESNQKRSHDDDFNHQQGMLKFITTAVCLFAGLMAIYEYYLLDSKIFIDYLEMSAFTANWFLNTFTAENVEIVGNHRDQMTKLVSLDASHAFIVVSNGCDASVVFATLISTVLAWPSPIIKRFLATIVGLAVMYAMNMLRISGMLLVDIHVPLQFDLYHEWILPGLLVAGPLAYFYIWTLISGTHPADA